MVAKPHQLGDRRFQQRLCGGIGEGAQAAAQVCATPGCRMGLPHALPGLHGGMHRLTRFAIPGLLRKHDAQSILKRRSYGIGALQLAERIERDIETLGANVVFVGGR